MDELNHNPENKDQDHLKNDNNSHNKPDIYPLISPLAAAFLGLVGGFFLYQFVGGILTLLIFGFDLETAPVNGLRLMTMAGQILFILLPALLFAKWIYGDVSKVISFKIPNWRELILFIVGIIVLTPLLQSYLYIQNFFIEKWAASSEFINSIKSLFDSLNELVEKTFGNLLSADNIPEMILVVIVIAVVPALAEEVMFRGFIQRSFEHKISAFKAAAVTAIFFGLYHFSPYGVLPLIALGLYFGFAAYLSKSLFIPVILHFLNNFTAVLLFFIIGDDEIFSVDATDTSTLEANIIYFFILLSLFGIVVFFIKRYYKKNKIT
ncbi:MAG: CPBP family intramembrane metalloprotease [Ignavibacteriaceae bacterium]|nr:CPBP family intramembrane metalloprotease [Ignavibacteriaceae bacterium]